MPTGVYDHYKIRGRHLVTKGSFKKGHTINVGNKHPESTKLKISKSHIGIRPSELSRIKMSLNIFSCSSQKRI